MELSKNKFGIYSSLGTAKMRRKHSLFTVEGEKSVKDTLGFFDLEAVVCLDGHVPDFLSPSMPCYTVAESVMKKLSNLSTIPDVMAIYRLPEINSEEIPLLGDSLYMVLDGIQDPGNLGTIIRTCHWFGIFDIFASRNTVDVFNPKTVQSTMGSIAKVRVHYCDLGLLFDKNPDLPVYGLLLDGKDIFKAELGEKGFIVMGNEGNGISTSLRKKITDPLLIPPGSSDHSESLNVAIAAAITMSRFVGAEPACRHILLWPCPSFCRVASGQIC